ncbi:MAG TPA: DUF167 domain-containing protein [Ktedonobacteraceae bacterium]
MRITVRVLPRSSKNELSLEGETLKARLTAPPVDGAANEALLKFLAERLNIPRRTLQIVQGATGRQKVVQIDETTSLTMADIQQKLGEAG